MEIRERENVFFVQFPNGEGKRGWFDLRLMGFQFVRGENFLNEISVMFC